MRGRWLVAGATAVVLALAPTLARTQEGKAPLPGDAKHPIDRALEACIDKDPSTAGMVQCIAKAEAAWDKEMNVQYARLRAKLKAPQKARLKTSQTAWLKYRDAETLTQRDFYGAMEGTMYRPMAADSHTKLVKQRALLLTRYAETADTAGR